MEYKATSFPVIDDLGALVRNAEAEAGGNRGRADRTIRETITKLFDDDVWSPKDLSPYIIARAALEPEVYNRFSPGMSSEDADELKLALTSSSFDNILHTVLAKVSRDTYMHAGGELIQLAEEMPTTEPNYIEFPALSGFDKLRERIEGAAFEAVKFGASKVKCRINDLGLLIPITQEFIWSASKFAELISHVEQLGEGTAQAIGEAITQTIEMGSTRPVYTATELATNLGFVIDGTNFQTAFYSTTTHTTIDGQTNPNQVAGAGAGITWAGFNAAYALLAAMVDAEGKAINIPMNMGLFPKVKEHDVRQMLETAQVTGSANNDKNTFSGEITPYFTPFFTSDTYYYLGAFKRALKWFWLEKPGMKRFKGGKDEVTNRIVATYRWAYYSGLCWSDYRYIVKAL